jgi:hypothetical protein
MDLWWLVVDYPGLGLALRPARDPAGRELLLTPVELEARARLEEQRARLEEQRAREAAERRVVELEAELKRREH